MPTANALPDVDAVRDPRAAELLLNPLRQRILYEAREAISATEVARRIDMPAQKVNYHVRTLVDAGLLVPAGTRTKRNLVERRYRATARSYVLLPEVLGDVGMQGLGEADAFSANHLMRLSGVVQTELGSAIREGSARGIPLPTLGLDAELRFESAQQRAAFASALREALTDVIGRFSSPSRRTDDTPGAGARFRLVVGCYPLPAGSSDGLESDAAASDVSS